MSLLSVCQYFCFELVLLIGIVVMPFVMLYVFLRSYRINRKAIFVKLSGLGTVNMAAKRARGTSKYTKLSRVNRSGSSLQTLYRYEQFVNAKLEKYQVQLLLLKFALCVLHALPQSAIQLYVLVEHSGHVYDAALPRVVFALSMLATTVSLVQFGWECVCNTGKRHLVEIFN